MRCAMLAIALLVYSCVPPTQPTPAVVARMLASEKRQSMVACTVNLNWTEEQLVQNCGPPDRFVAWAGHEGDRCALYRTSARSFAVGAGVEVIAACLQTPPKYGTNPNPPRVTEIVGLDSSILP